MLLDEGVSVGEVVRRLGVTQVTYFRWRRKEYGGMKVDQAKRLTDLEKENVRLHQLLADAELNKAILPEADLGNWRGPPASVSSSNSRVVSEVASQLTRH